MADMENFYNDLIIINLYFGCEKYRPKTAISQVQSPYYLGTTILVHHDCHGTVAASELLRPRDGGCTVRRRDLLYCYNMTSLSLTDVKAN